MAKADEQSSDSCRARSLSSIQRTEKYLSSRPAPLPPAPMSSGSRCRTSLSMLSASDILTSCTQARVKSVTACSPAGPLSPKKTPLAGYRPLVKPRRGLCWKLEAGSWMFAGCLVLRSRFVRENRKRAGSRSATGVVQLYSRECRTCSAFFCFSAPLEL